MPVLFEAQQLETVRVWAIENAFRFCPNGYGRRFATLALFPDAPAEIWTLKALIVERFGLQRALPEPQYRDLCSVITDGGAVHPHRDPNRGALVHTRFNVMVSQPVTGGQPIIEGEVFEVPEGAVYRVDAGLRTHATAPVQGNRPRIVLSFGFLCPATQFFHLPVCT